VVGWTNINVGADGSFAVKCEQWTNTCPNGVAAEMTAYAFLFTAIRLEQGEESGQPPQITAPMQNQTNLAGATVTFTMGAAGTAPLVYYWFTNQVFVQTNGTGSWTSGPLGVGSNFLCTVIVSNRFGAATNSASAWGVPATLTISQPADQLVCAGGVAVFSVTATGAPPIYFQWYKNNQLLSGETNASLVFDPVTLGEAGSYLVVVTNPYHSVTSLAAVLTVNRLPVMGPVTAWTLKNTPLVLPAARLLCRATDPDGDPVSITAVGATSAHGGSNVWAAGAITYAPASDFVGHDQFTFILDDSRGGFFTNTVEVTVASANAGSLNLVSPPRVVGGRFEAGFAGIPGETYTIEWKGYLTDPWQKLTNCTTPASGSDIGIIKVCQPLTGAEITSRFYRTVYPAY
jgi:hypothetical protein